MSFTMGVARKGQAWHTNYTFQRALLKTHKGAWLANHMNYTGRATWARRRDTPILFVSGACHLSSRHGTPSLKSSIPQWACHLGSKVWHNNSWIQRRRMQLQHWAAT